MGPLVPPRAVPGSRTEREALGLARDGLVQVTDGKISGAWIVWDWPPIMEAVEPSALRRPTVWSSLTVRNPP
jgi:hypothetical protein